MKIGKGGRFFNNLNATVSACNRSRQKKVKQGYMSMPGTYRHTQTDKYTEKLTFMFKNKIEQGSKRIRMSGHSGKQTGARVVVYQVHVVFHYFCFVDY